jgi:hypothetical protein
MATTEDIEAALAELRVTEEPNISQVATKFNIERTKLSRLYNGRIGTMEAYQANRQFLTPNQDQRLLQLVKKLTADGLPPTPKMVRQFAKDMSGELPGKNWASRWLDRHNDELQSGHLRGFDLARKKADSYCQYQAYFELVIIHVILLNSAHSNYFIATV